MVNVSPAKRSALVPLTCAAVEETSTNVVSSIYRRSMSLITTKQVIIFVKLAHSLLSLSDFPKSKVFDFWSKIDHDWAEQWGAGLSMRILASFISFAEISPSLLSKSSFLESFFSVLGFPSSDNSDSFGFNFCLAPYFVLIRFFSSVVCMLSSKSFFFEQALIISSASCLTFNFGGGKNTILLPFLFGHVMIFQF